MKKIVFFFCAMVVLSVSNAADFFDEGKLRKISLDTPIAATDTIGGFAIYQGDGRWVFSHGEVYSSSGRADPVPMGAVSMSQWEGRNLFARQRISSTLSTGSGSSWSGTPCGPGHLVMRNQGRGKEDHCMTIDARTVTVGPTPITFLSVVLTNSTAGWYQKITLEVNPALLGMLGTGLGDWTPETVEARAQTRAVLGRVSVWAEQFQDASIKAFAYSQPQDAYKSVPALKSLIPVPEDLTDQKYSMSFLGALEDTRNRKGFFAIAYAHAGDYQTAWGNAYAQADQAEANRIAMKNCNEYRKSAAPACKLYSFPM